MVSSYRRAGEIVRAATHGAVLLACCAIVWNYVQAACAQVADAPAPEDQLPTARVNRDPAAWGSDHVGQPFPEYVTGDECLFCHRKIGNAWNTNAHQRTMRAAHEDEPSLRTLMASPLQLEQAKQVHFLVGYRQATRFLKRSAQYGNAELLSTVYRVDGTLATTDKPTWHARRFAERCAGCHATGVDPKTLAFSATSLDCVVCHGVVDLQHTSTPGKVWLGAGKRNAQHVASICGQCHLRGGTSASSGRPYANVFVPGDNLFRDFRVDLSAESIGELPPKQRHIYENVRDIVIGGREQTTCLDCHHVHDSSTDKHQAMVRNDSCATCHQFQADEAMLVEDYSTAGYVLADHETCEWAPAKTKEQE